MKKIYFLIVLMLFNCHLQRAAFVAIALISTFKQQHLSRQSACQPDVHHAFSPRVLAWQSRKAQEAVPLLHSEDLADDAQDTDRSDSDSDTVSFQREQVRQAIQEIKDTHLADSQQHQRMGVPVRIVGGRRVILGHDVLYAERMRAMYWMAVAVELKESPLPQDIQDLIISLAFTSRYICEVSEDTGGTKKISLDEHGLVWRSQFTMIM